MPSSDNQMSDAGQEAPALTQILQLLTAQNQRLAVLEERLVPPQSTPQESVSDVPMLPEQKKKKATLPDPPRFDGNRKEFPAWLLELRYKLETDGPAIGLSKDQFSYIFSRLEKGAKAMTTTFAESGGPGRAFNPDAFLTYLSGCYGDPNLKQRALGRLTDLRQGDKESFAAFLPRFEKELADSGGAAWPGDVQINHLRSSLNQGLTKLLLGQRDMPTDYLGFIRALQQLGTNLDGERYQTRRTYQPSQAKSPSSGQRPSPSPDAMDWEPTKVNKAVLEQNKQLAGKRAKWVNRDEMERRRKEGSCFRCGRKECRIDKCPLRPAR
jgi:hypothetical protein